MVRLQRSQGPHSLRRKLNIWIDWSSVAFDLVMCGTVGGAGERRVRVVTPRNRWSRESPRSASPGLVCVKVPWTHRALGAPLQLDEAWWCHCWWEIQFQHVAVKRIGPGEGETATCHLTNVIFHWIFFYFCVPGSFRKALRAVNTHSFMNQALVRSLFQPFLFHLESTQCFRKAVFNG